MLEKYKAQASTRLRMLAYSNRNTAFRSAFALSIPCLLFCSAFTLCYNKERHQPRYLFDFQAKLHDIKK